MLDITELLKGKKILFLGSHPDDIELGAGGALWKLRNEKIELMVFSSAKAVKGNETIEDEFWESMNHFGTTLRTFLWQDIPTMEFYKYEDFIKARLFYCREHFKPDIIFCPSIKSDNSDHSVTGKCVANVFQEEQSILFYEDIRGGQKHEADLYVRLSSDDLMNKLKSLEYYKSQQYRKYFKPDATTSMAQFRGAQIGVTYAESFQKHRLVL